MVFRALGTKGKSLPHQRFTSYRVEFQIRKINIVNQQHTPRALLYLHSTSSTCSFLSLV